MGTTARKIVEISVVEDLIRAYCDEWMAYYLYQFMASTISGDLYPQLRDMLKETAKKEYEHSQELADMIVKLGGTPIPLLSNIADSGNMEELRPPENMSDMAAIVAVILESEAGAVEVYKELSDKTFGKDHATYALVSHILSEEIYHEETFENLKPKSGVKSE
jgi:bacterioferritin